MKGIATLGCLCVLVLAGCGGEADSDRKSDDARDREERAETSTAAVVEQVQPTDGDTGRQNDADEPVNTEPVESDPARAGWKTYRHALGASLKHPSSWSTHETPMGVALVPGDHRPNDELLLLWGMQAPAVPGEGLTSNESAMQMDALVSQVMPGLTRTGEPRALTSAHGPGAVYAYSGSAPDGRRLAAEVYFTVADGVGIGLTIVGLAERVAERSDEAELVFTSVGMRAPEPGDTTAVADGAADTDDPRLVGVFRGEALAGGGTGQAYVNTQLVNVLNADGTFLSGAQSHMHSSDRDYSGNLKWTAYNTSDGSVVTGRWSASRGVLTIVYDKGGRSVVAYGFEPDGTLAIRDAVTKKLINIYTRVH